jgi:energy-coupling factor transport system substrate-specific component
MTTSSIGTSPGNTSTRRRITIPASRPLLRYRTIDLVIPAMVGVAFGVVFMGWDVVYIAPSAAIGAVPLLGILGGPWLLAGVVGGLLVRRPGAALLTELIAAAVEAIPGTQWGWTTLISGTLQGLGVELALALFLWRRFGPGVAVLAGALAAAFEVVVYEWHAWYPDWTWAWKLGYLGLFALSGAVVAGLGGWFIVRVLAKTGAVRAMPAGQEMLERRAR